MTSYRISTRRVRRQIQRTLAYLQERVGDTVTWYEFDPAQTTVDDTYGEGPIQDPFDPSLNPVTAQSGLAFRPAVPIPVVWIRYIPPSEVQTNAGEYMLASMSFRVASSVMATSGLRYPWDPRSHFNDRFLYNGDLFRVEEYAPRGWLDGGYNMVDVSGRQLSPEELTDSTFPLGEAPTSATMWTPGQRLEWPTILPTDLEDPPDY